MSDLTTWLAELPAFVLVAGFALIGIALTLVVDVVLRRRMEAKTRTEAGRTAAIMLGVLANIYAVLIAFVIVQGWGNLHEAQTFVDAQATAMTEIRENTKVLGPLDAKPIDQSLDRLDNLVLSRQAAVTASDGSLPAPLYLLLALGASSSWCLRACWTASTEGRTSSSCARSQSSSRSCWRSS